MDRLRVKEFILDIFITSVIEKVIEVLQIRERSGPIKTWLESWSSRMVRGAGDQDLP